MSIRSQKTQEPEYVIIFDTTLRDGEQSPGAAMTKEEKLKVAKKLDEMGADVIEAGFPASSEGDFASVQAIAHTVKNAVICGLCRAKKEDILRTYEAIKDAPKKRIHTFISTSPVQMEMIGMNEEQVLKAITESVSYAKSLCDDVEWSAQDATRTDPDFLVKAVTRAVQAGAKTINIPDTLGYALPDEYQALFEKLIREVPGSDKVIFSAHCHNDLGMATANSLAAIKGGARQVHCTGNGLGERAGNAALEEIVMALKTRFAAMPFTTGINTKLLTGFSRLVAHVSGFPVQKNKAIVGENAFAHGSGIHQNGMKKNRSNYEIMTPESVGLSGSTITLTKHSGSSALQDRLEALGYPVAKEEIKDVFKRFKTIADKKKEVYDDDLHLMMGNGKERPGDVFKLVNLEVTTGTTRTPKAKVVMTVEGKRRTATAKGNGAISATFNAIDKIAPDPERTLTRYEVGAVTRGIDSTAEVWVSFEKAGRSVTGKGNAACTVEASAEAYIRALNNLSHPAPQDPSKNPAPTLG